MTAEERAKIVDLAQCDFRAVHEYYKEVSERNKNRSKEEKAVLKEKKDKEVEKYGFAWMDGYKQKIGNFRIEPPGSLHSTHSRPHQTEQGAIHPQACSGAVGITRRWGS